MTLLARLVAAGAGLALVCPGALAQTRSSEIATAAVDTSLFREGEVQRRNTQFGSWALDCDEIVRLNRRFCSLRALALDPQGTAVARITISTDDRGRPAALLDLPLGIELGRPVEITPQGGLVLGKPTAPLAGTTRRILDQSRGGAGLPGGTVRTAILHAALAVDLCDVAGCHIVWSLTPADIAAVRAGAGIQIGYETRTRATGGSDVPGRVASRSVKGVISSDGLGDAIQASLQ